MTGILFLQVHGSMAGSRHRLDGSDLYVAMTRAGSLTVSLSQPSMLCDVAEGHPNDFDFIETMNTIPEVDLTTSIQADLYDILNQIGVQHRAWLIDLWKRFTIRQEPITDGAGTLLAEPLFGFENGEHCVACFLVADASHSAINRLRQSAIDCVKPDDAIV